MTFPSTEMTMTEDAMTSGGNSRARVGFFYASWLLLRLQLLRFGRQLTAGLPFLNKKPAPGKRQATPGKARRGWLVAGLVALSISFTFFNIAQQTMSKIGEQMGTAAATDTVAKPGARRAAVRVPLPPAPGFALAPNVLKAVTAVMLLLLLASMLLAIGNGELTRPDWDLEWLATLPLPITTLLASRIASRAVISPMGLAALWPFLLTVAWYAGYRWAAPVMGLVAALPLLLIAAAVQTVCDTGLRLRLGPSQLRNLQAAVAGGRGALPSDVAGHARHDQLRARLGARPAILDVLAAARSGGADAHSQYAACERGGVRPPDGRGVALYDRGRFPGEA
jgi:hypothetical protein